MAYCPKCETTFEEGSKICRRCGAILEPLADESSQESAGFADRSPPQFWDKWDNGVQSQGEVEALSIRADASAADDHGTDRAASLPWLCSSCGQEVPGTFDVCWQCEASREDQAQAGVDAESPPSDTQPADVRNYLRDLAEEHGRNECARCGSTCIMRELSLRHLGQGSDANLAVVFLGSPDALIFKDPRYGEIVADVCGVCGRVELRVKNAEQLYEEYRDSQ